MNVRSLPPLIRPAAHTPPACPGGRLSRGDTAPPPCVHRTPGTGLRALGPALSRRLQLRTLAS